MSSLYVHIPFCRSKCLYCSFNSYSGKQLLHDRYVAALIREIKSSSRITATDNSLATLFIGGGTPTCLSFNKLSKIITTIQNSFSSTKDFEFTIEANPESVTLNQLRSLNEMGVNRISFGVQSFVDEHLKKLGRLHSAATAVEVVKWAEKAGFCNINVDLMYGLPEQTVGDHRYSLSQAVDLPIDHLSIYEMTIEKGARFFNLLQEGSLCLPPEEEIEEMDLITAEITQKLGFERYEISNYARSKHYCRHNIVYWKNQGYIGVGASAVSYTGGMRLKNEPDPELYCQKIETGDSPVVENEQLAHIDSFKESVIMGLRMLDGVDLDVLEKRYGVKIEDVYGEVLKEYQKLEVIELAGGCLRLTDLGLRYGNTVMAALV